MQFEVGATRPANLASDVFVLGFFGKPGRSSAAWREVHAAWGRGLESRLKLGGWTGRPFEVGAVADPTGLKARLLLVVCLGERGDAVPATYRELAQRVTAAVKASGLKSVAFYVDGAVDERAEFDLDCVSALAEGLVHGGYAFDALKKDPKGCFEPESVFVWYAGRKIRPSMVEALQRGATIARAQNIARDLVNEPANRINPLTLAERAVQVAAQNGLEVTVLNRDECAARSMHAFLAVGQGAAVEPRFVHLVYRPAKPKSRVVLVGKAVTFDSGGLCLKPPAGQATMKMDMGGSAAVIATMAAVGQLKPDVEVHGIFAACENMTGSNAYHTGDVLTASNGTTIEVLNTDAEGRLTLADALTYAAALKPDHLVDLATLTGACMVALGPDIAGIMGTGRGLIRDLRAAGDLSGEPMWELPLPPKYKELIKSKVADLANVGGPYGGAITAGLFLQAFVPDGVSWAHIDIAGPCFHDKPLEGQQYGATGYPVRALCRWIGGL